MIDGQEFWIGLRRTRKYILSHHEPKDYHRCYKLNIFENTFHLCARCSGIYPGILFGLLSYQLEWISEYQLLIIIFFPLPALADWFFTNFSSKDGFNIIRTTTGFLLGYGYGIGLNLLFIEKHLGTLVIGVLYCMVAAILLIVRQVKRRNRSK